MKKVLSLIAFILISISLIVNENPVAWAAPPKDNSKNPPIQVEYKTKKVRKPPYWIAISGSQEEDLSQSPVKAKGIAYINVIGLCDKSSVDDKWKFSIDFRYTFRASSEPIAGMIGGINFGIGGEISAYKDAFLNNEESKDPQDKNKKAKWKIDPKTGKWTLTPPEPTLAHSVEFEVEGNYQCYNLNGDNTFSGVVAPEDMSQWVSVKGNILGSGASGKQKLKLRVSIFSNDSVEVTVTAEGKTYGPYKGKLASEWDLEAKRREKAKWPIWGVWTNASPYESMPNIERDLKEIDKDSNKKINYKNGSWVMLKEGKGEDVSEYKILRVTDDDIVYETGEVWVYPGSALFVPKEKKNFSRDLRESKFTGLPNPYPQEIRYSTITDTIQFLTIGNMVRVRSINLTGVWSVIEEQVFPDVKKTEGISGGTWYKFTRNVEVDGKDKNTSGANYNFIRVTSVEGGEVKIDRGIAVLYPLEGDEIMRLSDIESEKTSRDGKSSKENTEMEYIGVSDYDKTKGEIKISGITFHLVSPPALKGRWSTLSPAVEPPDIENGGFKVRDSEGMVFDPPKGAQWMLFDGEKRRFTWIENLKDVNGILVRKGDYRLIQGNTPSDYILELIDITGSYYPEPGEEDAHGFTNKEYMYGALYFNIKFDEKSFSMGGVDFIPIPKTEK